jgi:hypothetical protein
MAFTVRIYGHRGMVQTKILIPQQDSRDSVFLLQQPYEFRAFGVSNGLTPVLLGPSATIPDVSTVLRVEVPDSQVIRYEINTPTRSVSADANSPTLSGVMQIMWNPGWTFSFIDATGT